MMTFQFEPKPNYKDLYTKTARYKLLWGGRGRGGSHEATLYSLYKQTCPVYCRIAFLRQIFKDCRSSLWQDYKDRYEQYALKHKDYFAFNDSEMRSVFGPTRNFITTFGVKADPGRTAKLKSLANYNTVIIEELDELEERDFDELDVSLRTKKGGAPEIVGIFNPPPVGHWIWKKWFIPQESKIPGFWKMIPKQDPMLLSIFSTYYENLANIDEVTAQSYEKFFHTRPDYYWGRIRGLVSEGNVGAVFKKWSPITDEQFNAVEARSLYGLDWGTASPCGLVEVKMRKNDIYVRELNYKPMSDKEIATRLCALGITTSETIIADSAEPFSIARLRRGWSPDELTDKEKELYPNLITGFSIYSAPNKGIKAGIDALLESNVYVTQDSKNLWNEYANYRWALDKNKNPTDDPEDANNHLIDPLRYVRMARGRYC